MFCAKTRLTLTVIVVLCLFMGHARCKADETTSTFEDTIKWLTDRGHQYGTFQPKIGEEIPPVETQFALTAKCQLQVTMTGGCGFGGPLDRNLYEISLGEIDLSASAIKPVFPVGAVDEYLLVLKSVERNPDAFRTKRMNVTTSTWTSLSEIRLCTGSSAQAYELRSHINRAASLCGAAR